MNNYYEILGVNNSANLSEIKNAFRKLAKIYHPDKNAESKEHFLKILKAYETLSNPKLKSTYDYNLNYNKNFSNYTRTNDKTVNKNYSFNEKELQRRKYYDEHIKKYAKHYNTQSQEQIKKSSYNEFKYVLYATPIAVILFVVIAFVATPNEDLKNKTVFKKTEQLKIITLDDNDVPFAPYFGKLKFDTFNKKTFKVANKTISDIIVCIFKSETFVRSTVVKSGMEIEILNLPKGPLQWRVCCGNDWSYDFLIKSKSIYGNFTKNVNYYSGKSDFDLTKKSEITLFDLQTQLNKISEEEFFKN